MKKYALILGITFFLTGCANESREPDYFSLATVPGDQIMHGTVTTVRIEQPVMAGYLDRPDFVRQEDDYQLLIDNTDNWAEPLDKMFARILAADLQQRLPDSIIVTEDNVTPPDLRFAVDITIEQFNQFDDKAILNGEMILTDRTTNTKQLIPLRLTAQSDGSPESVAKGMSELTGEVATALEFSAIVPALDKTAAR